jgi:hypothetical protein
MMHILSHCRESTHSVNVKWLKDVTAQLESLSSMCVDMMHKCQHKRIQQVSNTVDILASYIRTS